MHGRMMDAPLNLHAFRRRGEEIFREAAVITNSASGPTRTTLGAVLGRAARLAHVLASLGVRPGDRVATLAWNTQEHLEAYIAVPCMGAVLHTLNLRLTPRQIAWIANDGEDRVLLVDASLAPLLEQIHPLLTTVRDVILIPDDYEELLAAAPSAPYPWPQIDEQAAAAMCFTSGTTGEPKGVVYSHRSTVLHAMSNLLADSIAISQHDTVLPVVPMFHANAWGMPYAALAAGADLVLPGPLLQPEPLADLIEGERVTVAAGVPTIWFGLVEELRRRPRDLSALRCIPCGGAAIPEALMLAFDEVAPGRLLHAWGMTETSPIASVATLPRDAAGWSEDERRRYRLSQGRPLLGVDLRLAAVDGSGAAPWDGETMGEIQVRGPWIAASYHRDLEADRFADGWFSTGDVAVGNPDGTFQILDRTRDLIKSGGEWISSVELEGIIVGHPAIREAAVVSRPDERWSERPVACVVLRDGDSLTLAALREWLDGRVPRFWLPDDLIVLADLPKTSVGKLDKKVMRADHSHVDVG